MKKRIFSLLMALCMVASVMPMPTHAEEETYGCGKTAHTHQDSCYSAETVEAVCGLEVHSHDDTCLAAPDATVAQPDPVAEVQALVDALPDPATLTAADRERMDAQMQTISDAIAALTPEQQAQLNLDAFYAVASALENLPKEAYEPMTVAKLKAPEWVSYSYSDMNGLVFIDVRISNVAHAQNYTLYFYANGREIATKTAEHHDMASGVTMVSGMSTFLEGLGPGRYTIYARANAGGYESSDLSPGDTFTYGEDPGAPQITGITAVRDSVNQATVSFTSSQKGDLVIGGVTKNLNKGHNTATITLSSEEEAAVDFTVRNYYGTEATYQASIPPYVRSDELTVTYYSNGGSGTVTDSNVYSTDSVVTVLDDTGLTAPDFHFFDGWNTASDGSGTSYPAGSTFPITSYMNLYAQWKQVEYSLSASKENIAFGGWHEGYSVDVLLLNDRGGFTVTNNGSQLNYLAYPTSQGAFELFKHESTALLSPGRGAKFTVKPKANLAPGSYRETFTITGVGSTSVNITVSFTVNGTYKRVTINAAAGGTAALKNGWEGAVMAGQTAELTVTPDEGYYLKGWTTDPADLVITENHTFTMPNSAVTITPVFAQPIVTFDLNGKEGTAPASQTVAVGGNATEPTVPTARGYAFDGWYTDETCTEGNEFNFSTAITGDITLYAKWASTHSHTWSTEWTKDGTAHWHECTAKDCPITDNNDKDGYAEHTIDKKIADAKFLKSSANCNQKAVYYSSCECGSVGTTTFESGEINPDAHSYVYTLEEYQYTGKKITEACENGCNHSAYVTLIRNWGATYTGQPITTGLVVVGCSNTDMPTVTYTQNGQAINEIIYPGTYTASITFGDKTATVETSVYKAIPTADIFDFMPPANLNACDGLAKVATVTVKEGVKGVGIVTITYFKDGKALDGAPTTVGTYTVEITVAEGTNYNAADDLTVGTFTFDITDSTDHTNVTLVSNGNGTHDKVCSVCEKVIESSVACSGTTTDNCDEGYKCTCGGYFGTKEHNFTVPQKDSTDHWNKCSDCDAIDEKIRHSGIDDGDCKTPVTCPCGTVVIEAKNDHSFDNACDTDCNNAGCSFTRTITHTYAEAYNDTQHWQECSVCHGKKDVAAHSFDDDLDSTCNGCSFTRVVSYTITKGNEQTVIKGNAASFTSNAPFNKFVKVQVDGADVSWLNYTVDEGSTIVTLSADFIKTLSAGEHTLRIVSDDGWAQTTFKVKARPADSDSPKTGDITQTGLWLALAVVGLLGLTGSFTAKKYYRKRK